MDPNHVGATHTRFPAQEPLASLAVACGQVVKVFAVRPVALSESVLGAFYEGASVLFRQLAVSFSHPPAHAASEQCQSRTHEGVVCTPGWSEHAHPIHVAHGASKSDTGGLGEHPGRGQGLVTCKLMESLWLIEASEV